MKHITKDGAGTVTGKVITPTEFPEVYAVLKGIAERMVNGTQDTTQQQSGVA